MNIKEHKIKVRDLVADYSNDAENGVSGYHGKLDIRPPYQREFVYKDDQRDEVIRTILRKLPLNVMYWCETGEDTYEVMDGQQRTISICEYVNGSFSVSHSAAGDTALAFSNLPEDMQNRILDYELFVYICSGDPSEKLEWFKIINIAGEALTAQELRNAVYSGPWTMDAKRYFSKTGCAASSVGDKYLKGQSIRQEYLQTALSWIAAKEGITIEDYMAKHQNDPNAVALWNYFRSVLDWVQAIFPKYRKEMKGLPWGLFYNVHGERTDLDPVKLEAQIVELMADDDVTKKNGVYEYLLTGNEKCLSIRAFDERTKRTLYEKQGHKCAICGKECELSDMDADHITPWSKGGKTIDSNCQMLCKECNLKKSSH